MATLLLGLPAWLASQLACCCGMAACRCLTCNGRSNSSTVTRVVYALLFLVTSLTAWIMESPWVVDQLDKISLGYLKQNCPENTCYGNLAVYRLLFASSFIHILLGLIMIGQNSSTGIRGAIQNGYWGPKMFAWLALSATCFFIPNGFFIVWSKWIAIPGAAFFMLFQLFLLVDFAHNAAEYLLEKWETTEERIWIVLLAGGTLGALLLALVLTILGFVYFGPSGCRLNQTFVSINLLLCLAAAGLSVAPAVQEANPRSGLAQAGIVVVYATYLVMSAMSSEPVTGDEEPLCNPLGKSGGAKTSTVIIGAVITFVAIAYSTTRAAGRGIALPDGEIDHLIPTTTQPTAPNAALNQALESGAIRPSTLTEDSDGYAMNDDEIDGTVYDYSWFHFVFAAAAMYVAMLITNWTTVSVNDGLTSVGRGWASVWVRATTSWIVLLLYVWTLLAPIVLPDREWN